MNSLKEARCRFALMENGCPLESGCVVAELELGAFKKEGGIVNADNLHGFPQAIVKRLSCRTPETIEKTVRGFVRGGKLVDQSVEVPLSLIEPAVPENISRLLKLQSDPKFTPTLEDRRAIVEWNNQRK